HVGPSHYDHDQHAGDDRGHRGGRVAPAGAHHHRRGAHNQDLCGRDRGRRLCRRRFRRGAPGAGRAGRLSAGPTTSGVTESRGRAVEGPRPERWEGRAMPALREWELCPDVDMVLRAQGADPSQVRARRSRAVDIAEQAIAQGGKLLQPAVALATVRVEELRHEQLRLVGGGVLAGPLVAQHLYGAKTVVAAVCTIGPALEEAASGYFADDPAFSVALDAFGSAAVDLLAQAVCERVDDEAVAEGLKTTIAITPGLVGWPLAAGQRQ